MSCVSLHEETKLLSFFRIWSFQIFTPVHLLQTPTNKEAPLCTELQTLSRIAICGIRCKACWTTNACAPHWAKESAVASTIDDVFQISCARSRIAATIKSIEQSIGVYFETAHGSLDRHSRLSCALATPQLFPDKKDTRYLTARRRQLQQKKCTSERFIWLPLLQQNHQHPQIASNRTATSYPLLSSTS